MTAHNPSSVSDMLIADELVRVRKFLSEKLDCSDERLSSFIDYLKHRQGKMLRASVVLLGGRLSGDITELHIEVAAVVEMIHAATLLHDDVIDNSHSRRGDKTANNLWGANLAVLLGDYLLSKAFLTMESLQRSDVNRILTDTAATICQGEMLQNTLRGESVIGVEEYLEVIEKKTAVFFANCALLGAIISGADDDACEALYNFGLNLGMAFQINDDLIDIVGKEDQTGKTGGRDVENKILTLPAIKSVDFAKSQIVHYRQKAVSSLERFGDEPAACGLKELADSATQLPA